MSNMDYDFRKQALQHFINALGEYRFAENTPENDQARMDLAEAYYEFEQGVSVRTQIEYVTPNSDTTDIYVTMLETGARYHVHADEPACFYCSFYRILEKDGETVEKLLYEP